MKSQKSPRASHTRRGRIPTQTIAYSFALLILAGTGLLLLPCSTRHGISLPDALFTATSAACVTGLVAVDTYTAFTGFGQAVVLGLIQIGGLGLVTLTSFFAMTLRRRMSFHSLQLAGESIGAPSAVEARHLLGTVIKVAFACEGLGAAALCAAFVPEYGPVGVWISVFLAVSAFCNAGFDILGRIAPYASLTAYTSNWYVQGVLMALIVSGGLGFLVWQELAALRRTKRISLHTQIVLAFTGLLLFGGALVFAALEWHNPATLGGMPVGDKIAASLFQSVSARTAGFNTVDLAGTNQLTRLLLCMLMFVGAAPGGTGGGIKVTTFSVLAVTVLSVARGREDAVIFGRRIPKRTVYRAMAIALLSLAAVMVASVTMFFNTSAAVTEMDSLFESVSAFATVGVSIGVTATMNHAARIVTMITMFAGRVGPVSLAISLAAGDSSKQVWEVLPEGRITVG